MIQLPPVRRFLTPNDILNNLYPNPLTLAVPQGLNTIVKPKGDITVVYGAGNVAFGGASSFRIGYPNHLDYVGGFNNFAINDLISKMLYVPSQGSLSLLPLGDFTNQPLVASFFDNSAEYGPITSSSLVSGGAGYAAGEKVPLAGQNFDTVINVLTVNGSGKILTYNLTVGSDTFLPGVISTNVNYVKTISINNGGSSYLAGEEVGVGDGGPNSPYYVIDTVDGGGAALTGHLRLPGYNQTTGTAIAAVGGSGSGLLFDITAIGGGTGASLTLSVSQGNGYLYIEFDVEVITIPFPIH